MRMLVFAALTAVLTPLAANAELTQRGNVVRPLAADTFEVPWRGRSGPRDFWCIAGEYARYNLGLAGRTPLYRTSAVPRRAGEAVRFSTSPVGAQPTGLALIGGGNSISVAHALLQCDRR